MLRMLLNVTGQQIRKGHRVIVQEDDQLALRGADASIAGGAWASVGLFECRERIRRFERAQELARAIARAVVNDEDFELVHGQGLRRQRIE
jgi:hypothetical protein